MATTEKTEARIAALGFEPSTDLNVHLRVAKSLEHIAFYLARIDQKLEQLAPLSEGTD